MYNIEDIFLKTETLQKGHFQYSSGRHGEEYMQCAKVLMYPEYAAQVAQLIADAFKDDKVDIVLAPAMGGILIGYEVARALGAVSIFSERNKQTNKMELRRGFQLPKDARIIICEDVVTTGLSTREVIELVEASEAKLVGVCSMVDRAGGEIDFGVKFFAPYSKKMASYAPEECPLCKKDIPLVKPGSR